MMQTEKSGKMPKQRKNHPISLIILSILKNYFPLCNYAFIIFQN